HLYMKDEAFNPTGTFKARGLAAAVSVARELGVKAVALPSAGNAGGAAAAYCARAGIVCHLFMPKDTPRANIAEAVIYGARVALVDGLIHDCGRLVKAGQEEHGWFDLSTLKEPYRLEGKKTMGYELALDFGLELPDVILYPTGGGTGLIGMWKAFEEMERLAWIGPRRPKMVVVQSSGCAPIVKAWREGRREAPLWEHAETIASGLRVPAAIGDFLMLDIVRQSNGWGVDVSDEAILHAQGELAREQGLYICPEGAACWAALKQLVAGGKLGGEERILLFNTGVGLKYTDLVPLDLPVLQPPPR
ncbi:MAG: threonine synthase, partial [Deltaproteobacteria bacterium]|nr:threonine synthase [Deltaproteobacteria bacterium]